MTSDNTQVGALVVAAALIAAMLSPAARAQNAPGPDGGRGPKRKVTIAVLQAGARSRGRANPGSEANFALFADLARNAAASQPRPDMICFPEYAISGWPYPKEEVINGLAEAVPGTGHWYQSYRALARETGVPLLCWLVESAGGKLYNSAFLLDGKGEFKGKYRKVQANLLEQTKWGWSQGERFEILELDGVRYGVSICADMFFPETVRCLELLGADVVIHLSIDDDMGHLVPARAVDSKLPIVMSIFLGGSYAVDAEGKLLGKLTAEGAAWRSFTLEPFRSFRQNDRPLGVVADGKKAWQNMPNVGAYGVLTDPSRRPPWTEVFLDKDGRPQTREQLLKRFKGRYDAHDPAPPAPKTSALPRLRVSGDGHFLVKSDGQPFFWLGDTAWGLVAKAAREDAASQPSVLRYLDNRAAKGFNVIQTVLAGQAGAAANAYGQPPFHERDFTRPRLLPGPDDDYWDMVDWLVDRAAERGIYSALLPLWLSDIPPNHPLQRDPDAAYRYGHFLGQRYGAKTSVLWVLGGDAWQADRNVGNPARMAMIRALAEGLADGAKGEDRRDGQADWSTTLMTFHPPGDGRSSSLWLHGEPWLDFNMIQTTTRFEFANYDTVARDYAKLPAKPTLDAEVAYEDSLSLDKNEPKDRRTTAWDARRAAYWAVFAGALGHTYGHRSFISFLREGETSRHGAHVPWFKSLDAPGGFHMTHLKQLMTSLTAPLERVPDQSLLAGDTGQGKEHVAACRARDGS